MASPNLTELVTVTLRNRRKKLADNVLNHNALLRKLNEQGNVQLESGGRTLVEELEYAENSTFKYYDGYETLDISPSDVFSAAEFDWKQAATVVTISGKERRMNSGKEQSIRLLDRRMKNAEKTLMNNISTGVYSDGTGTSSKQIGGLQLLVADDADSGTIGGIAAATYSFWNNQVYDISDHSLTLGVSGHVQTAMNALWLQCVRGPDHPNMWVMNTTHFAHFWAGMQAIQRITDEKSASSGYRSLAYYGPGGKAEVFHDDAIASTRSYALNTDYLFWRVHRDANMEPLTDRESINQDATVVPIIFMGNLTVSNRSLQGVMVD